MNKNRASTPCIAALAPIN